MRIAIIEVLAARDKNRSARYVRAFEYSARRAVIKTKEDAGLARIISTVSPHGTLLCLVRCNDNRDADSTRRDAWASYLHIVVNTIVADGCCAVVVGQS